MYNPQCTEYTGPKTNNGMQDFTLQGFAINVVHTVKHYDRENMIHWFCEQV